MSQDLRMQQHASRAAFFIPGFAMAAWAPLVPIIKSRAGLNESTLGLILLCLGAGALLAMPLAGPMCMRYGCKRVLIASVLLIALALSSLPYVQAPWMLAVILFFFGVGNGVMDCSINIQAVMVERDSGRVMMSGFHAFYSIGGLVGVCIMTTMLTFELSAAGATALVALLLLSLAFYYSRFWRRDRTELKTRTLVWPKGSVVFIGMLCFIAFLAEGVILDWSAVFLNEVRAVDMAHAGLGYATFAATMTLARLIGDKVVTRLGKARTLTIGASGACIGFLLAIMLPHWQLTLLAFALIGLCSANVVPVLFSMAGKQKSMSANQAITAVTTLGYAGVLAGPALIGFIAQITNLVLAFLVVAIALLGVATAPKWLRFD